MTIEMWRAVPGWEREYWVSDAGRVMSLARTLSFTRLGSKCYRQIGPRFLRPGIASTGYFMVRLSRNGTGTGRTIHSLVASAFLGDCPDGMQIDHIDGDRLNNNASNLRYVTSHENTLCGAATWVPQESVREIRRLRRRGVTGRVLAARFGVSIGYVSDIHTGRRRKEPA